MVQSLGNINGISELELERRIKKNVRLSIIGRIL